MCGIIGVFDRTGSAQGYLPSLLRGMDQMAVRGPDGAESFGDGPVLLGHRRLAVIDINGGQQPWHDPQSGITGVYNGEIYNYRELRKELISLGHSFRSESDTEVLMRAYREWGPLCLDRLVGMFAFAIWDPCRSELFLARDRLGVKPLYFADTGDSFYFASSVAALREFPAIGSSLDLHAVSHYLTTVRTTMGQRTLLRDIKTLEPGCALLINSERRLRQWRYWDLEMKRAEDKTEPTLEDAAEQLFELLDKAVADRLQADVDIGCFLSGGIDSAAIVSQATSRGSGQLQTYSMGFDREGYNEWPFVRDTANHFDLANTEITAEESNYLELWSQLIDNKGLPLSTPNEVGIYLLAKELSNDCTVALSGEGADEILGGYAIPFFSAKDFDRSQTGVCDQFRAALIRLYGRDSFESRTDHFFSLNSWLPTIAKWSLLNEDVSSKLQRNDLVFEHYEELLSDAEDCSTMDAYLHVHTRVNLEGLLNRMDSSTMAAGVEARAPFTDHRLVEYAFSLPDSLKLDWSGPYAKEIGASMNVLELQSQGFIDSKRTLRQAFQDKLPSSVVNRPKMSFPTPFVETIRGELSDTIGSILRDSPLVGSLFQEEAMSVLAQSNNIVLWPVANLCLWAEQENVSLS